MMRPAKKAGNMAKSLCLLLLVFAACESAPPYQCAELQQVISGCSCEARYLKEGVATNQVIINCSNNNFTTVPTITGSSNHIIYEMTLFNNQIQTIPAAAFRGLRIQRIDLRKNRLTTFNNNSFKGLENDLKELYLGAQKQAGVQPPIDSLTALNSLTTLQMDHFKVPTNHLEPGIFNRLTDLQTLILKHNGLLSIEPLALPLALTYLTLDDQKLSAFPGAIRELDKLESLTIRNTDISTLVRYFFEMNTKLTYLDLSRNRINTMESGCFRGITASLQNLSLAHNPIPSVDTVDEVKELTALRSLDLSFTTLSTLPVGASFLINKESLNDLYLEGNSLATLGPSVFGNLGRLQGLYLSENQLATLDNQVFSGLSSLKDLDLSHQTITQGRSLSMPQSLSTLTSLEKLTLTKTTVDPTTLWDTIGSLRSLQLLFLDGTSLASVPDFALKDLTQLTELHLKFNSLTSVTQKTLAGLRNLKKLLLSRNSITTLSPCAVYGFYFSTSNPLALHLYSNPLHCDCKLSWLLKGQEAGNITLFGLEQCVSPADKNGTNLSDLTAAQLTCATVLPEESCMELYTTTTTPDTTAPPSPVQGMTITNTTANSITVGWTPVPGLTVPHMEVLVQNLDNPANSIDPVRISPDANSYRATQLEPNTQYSVCLLAYGYKTTCVVNRTSPASGTDGLGGDDDDDNSQTIIIVVVCIVGLVVLAIIVAAILYLLVCRKRRSKEVHSPPHVFAPGELPAMTPESKQFSKPKAAGAGGGPPRVGRALDDIKVNVISDGQTGAPISPRHSVGSYQFLDEKHPNPNPGLVPPAHGAYTNDVDSRPLPSAPNSTLPQYHNMGGGGGSYNEIE